MLCFQKILQHLQAEFIVIFYLQCPPQELLNDLIKLRKSENINIRSQLGEIEHTQCLVFSKIKTFAISIKNLKLKLYKEAAIKDFFSSAILQGFFTLF